MEIKNKVAIITGASSGIGLATAKLFASKGASTALVARSKDKLARFASELQNSLAVPCDMTDADSIKDMIKKVHGHYGHIDILVNNAGQGLDSPVQDMDIKKFRYIFDLNLVGPIVAMQQVIPFMKKQGGGAIVNISSGLSKMYLPNMSGYASLKAALNNITLTAREELKKDKIIVSVVYPYITATNFEKNTLRGGNYDPGQEDIDFGEENGSIPPPDSAEMVAEKILDVVISGNAEQFVHDWLGRR